MSADLRIAHDHAAFAGHFPGFPILPGAALLDAALHEIVIGRKLDLTRWQVATVKFLGFVRPGDVLTLEHSASSALTIRFVLHAAGAPVASGMLTGAAAAMRDANGV